MGACSLRVGEALCCPSLAGTTRFENPRTKLAAAQAGSLRGRDCAGLAARRVPLLSTPHLPELQAPSHAAGWGGAGPSTTLLIL